MDLEDVIITVFCLIDEVLPQMLSGQRMRQCIVFARRHPMYLSVADITARLVDLSPSVPFLNWPAGTGDARQGSGARPFELRSHTRPRTPPATALHPPTRAVASP